MLAGLENWFAGRVLERLDFGDHVGFLLEPVEVRHGDPGGRAVPFSRAKDVDPGHMA